MAAYAGLIDRVDQELGRLFADLKRAGEFDNTLILFFSDNGACPFDRRQDQRSAEPYQPDTMWGDSTGWAWVRNSPFRFYKQNQFEGGIATPAIVHWPAGLKTSPARWSTLPRISWTCCRRSRIWPARVAESAGRAANWRRCRASPWPRSSPAKSLPVRPPIHLLFGSDRGLLDGDWKLVSFQSNPWELYNIAEDRTELHNLAAEKPEIRDRLVNLWQEMAENVLHAPERSRGPVSATAQPYVNPGWTDFSVEPGESVGKMKRKAKRQKQ